MRVQLNKPVQREFDLFDWVKLVAIVTTDTPFIWRMAGLRVATRNTRLPCPRMESSITLQFDPISIRRTLTELLRPKY